MDPITILLPAEMTEASGVLAGLIVNMLFSLVLRERLVYIAWLVLGVLTMGTIALIAIPAVYSVFSVVKVVQDWLGG